MVQQVNDVHPVLPTVAPQLETPHKRANGVLPLPSVVELPPTSLRQRSVDSAAIPIPHHLYHRLPAHALLPDGTPDYLQLILTSRCYELVKETPMTEANNLGAKLGVRVSMKREDLQPVFSFKIRGAYNLMAQLTEDERWHGVVACSAGNHAQGVALSARHLGIAATIVMPLATPSIKHSNVSALGARVVLHGDDFDASKLECQRLMQHHGLINIPPYDDPYVIAGQGTVAMEILRQVNMTELDAVFVCVGGGGLLAGVAAYIKRIAPPHVKVIGVEARDQTALTQSMLSGQRELLSEVGLFSDGTAVRIVGEETFRVCYQYVDAMVLVSNDEVCAAIKDVFQDTRSIPEPSGALAIAGLKRYVQDQGLVGSGKRFVAIASGANMNFDRLRFVAERAALGEGKEVLLSVSIPETPGSFVRLHSYIHPRAVTEFSYRYSSPHQAHILISFTLKGSSEPTHENANPGVLLESVRQDELDSVLEAIRRDPGGMVPSDISDNEVAKSHVRYLVGGRKSVSHERLLSFAFPERPGALRKFLAGLGEGQNENESFNVSLFHYRNLGGDVSRVLAGIQVDPSHSERFERFLANLGYPYTDETDNEVYRDFLAEIPASP